MSAKPDHSDAIALPASAPALSDKMTPTVFHEPWWLEIAGCQVVEVESGGKVVGRLPYLLSRRFGIQCSVTPVLTHFLGPAIDEGEGNANTRFLKRRSITRELIVKLPPVSLIKIKCHWGITETIAFQEENFMTTVQYTCEVEPAAEEVLWKNMRDKTRNVIRRAQDELTPTEITDVDEFLNFYKTNLAERKIKSYFDIDICHRLVAASLQRNRGRIYALRDKSGQLDAAIFCVWDKKCAYYLMTTNRMESNNGAVSLLIWEAIKDAASKNLSFDFDGLHNRGSALFYSGFSANMKPRYIVTRAANLLMRFAWEFRDAMKEGSAFH